MAINILKASIGQGLVNLGSVRKGDTVQLELTIDNISDLDVSKFKLKSSDHEQMVGFTVVENMVTIDLDGQFTELEAGIVYMDLEIVSLSGKITTSKFYMLLNDVIKSNELSSVKKIVGGEVEAVNNIATLDLAKGVYNLEIKTDNTYMSDNIFIRINNGDLINLKHYNHMFNVGDIKVKNCVITGVNNNFSTVYWRAIV